MNSTAEQAPVKIPQKSLLPFISVQLWGSLCRCVLPISVFSGSQRVYFLWMCPVYPWSILQPGPPGLDKDPPLLTFWDFFSRCSPVLKEQHNPLSLHTQLLAQPFPFQHEGSAVPQWLPSVTGDTRPLLGRDEGADAKSQPSVPLCCLFSDDEDEKNDDTVEKIVRCIIQNQGERFHGWLGTVLTTLPDTFPFFPLSSANVEALKEMLGENEGDVPVPVPR